MRKCYRTRFVFTEIYVYIFSKLDSCYSKINRKFQVFDFFYLCILRVGKDEAQLRNWNAKKYLSKNEISQHYKSKCEFFF